MNQPTKLRSCFTLATSFVTVLVLAGCMMPHTEVRAPELRGRVLDARTKLPVVGAKVFFCDPPEEAVYTDANGYFLMKEAKVTYSMSYGGHVYPIRKDNGVCISHKDYDLEDYWPGYDKDPLNILLKPKQ
jgi:hypothetical protein